MFEQDVVELTETDEVEFVPDVICPNPNCGALLRIPRETYAWYEGPVPCRFCHSTMHLSIGDTRYGNKRTKPFTGSYGGKLLEPPTLILEANPIPAAMTEGLGSNVPQAIRETFETAIQHFNRTNYTDAAVRCRFTIETALCDRGVGKDLLTKMISDARMSGLITENIKDFCLGVNGIGGNAAHVQTNPARYVDRSEALLAIDATGLILRRLYPLDRILR